MPKCGLCIRGAEITYPETPLESTIGHKPSSTDEGREAGRRIFAALQASEDQEPVVVINVGREPLAVGNLVAEQTAPADVDDEVHFIEKIPGDVAVTEVVIKSEAPEVLVIIEEDTNAGPNPNSDGGVKSTPAISPPMPLRERARRSCKRPRVGGLPKVFNKQVVTLVPLPACEEKLLLQGDGHVELKLWRPSRKFLSSKWKVLLVNYGELIKEMDCIDWTWNEPENLHLGSNLYQVLSYSLNLLELRIQSRCKGLGDYLQQSPKKSFSLPNLQYLKISHDGDMNYQEALRLIIAASPKLEKIEFEYKDGNLLRSFLETLKGMESGHLASIKNLSIKEKNDDSVALMASEVEMLADVQADNLEDLFLGFSLWEETKDSLEKMLNRFINLKRLTIQGCFITTEKQQPKIKVDFPVMPQLEFLNLGKSYKFSSILETTTERPTKRRKFSTIVRTEEVQGERRESSNKKNGKEDRHNLSQYFPVTLNIPALSKLKTLMLGALYEIEDLHFANFRSLECFQVSSPWHLTVKFPPLDSRHKTYPKVTQIQFPDTLQDHTFVGKVVTHFPNIEKCWIHLPTVKVLRAFSKVMNSLNPLHLKELDLKIQFDFGSSLDWAFLEKPSVAAPQSPEELRLLQVLKSYEHWGEYAKVYNIDIPDEKDLPKLEDQKQFSGLGSLCQKLRGTLVLKVEHIPRTLRLPKGDEKWDDDDCEFTDELIGFGSKDKEYPFSAAAWELVPLGTTIEHFKLPPKAFEVAVSDPVPFFEVDTSIVMDRNKDGTRKSWLSVAACHSYNEQRNHFVLST